MFAFLHLVLGVVYIFFLTKVLGVQLRQPVDPTVCEVFIRSEFISCLTMVHLIANEQ